MTTTSIDEAQRAEGQTGPTRHTTKAVKAGVATGFAVLLVGGYAGSWKWTGFPDNSSLWDWLHLALLPAAFGTLPLWLRERTAVGARRKRALGILVVAFAVLVALGYGLNWRWTGFPGNTLWDWLELLLLPAVVIAWPVLREQVDRLGAVHVAGLASAAVGLGVLIAGGYGLHWSWTGFAGNTLWDWLQLLLLPFVLPCLVLPSLVGWMTVEIESNKAERAGRREAEALTLPEPAGVGERGLVDEAPPVG